MNGLRLLFVLLAVTACRTERITEPDWQPIGGQIIARDKSISIGGPPTIHVKDAQRQSAESFFSSGARQTSSGALPPESFSRLPYPTSSWAPM
jgi:hypothetical protein